jgi:hypothetical protein
VPSTIAVCDFLPIYRELQGPCRPGMKQGQNSWQFRDRLGSACPGHRVIGAPSVGTTRELGTCGSYTMRRWPNGEPWMASSQACRLLAAKVVSAVIGMAAYGPGCVKTPRDMHATGILVRAAIVHRIRRRWSSQDIFAAGLLSCAANTAAYLRPGTRMKMCPPVDLRLARHRSGRATCADSRATEAERLRTCARSFRSSSRPPHASPRTPGRQASARPYAPPKRRRAGVLPPFSLRC